MEWEAVIGLEVHIQLLTATKLFCRCRQCFGAPPNTLVCETCLGYPGALPVPNRGAIDQAIRLALALGATIPRRSAFDRKSYFYADLPKGYQITQQRHPLALGGRLPVADGTRFVPLHRLHLEEDAGKSIRADGEILVDFNRAGVPLVELVTAPVLDSADAARDALRSLHQVLRYTDISDGRMAEGSLRCDVNISLRRPGNDRLGARVEIKNVSSFRQVGRAIDHEIERQAHELDAGRSVESETRSWDESTGRSRCARDKEVAADYRFHPEPDLPPIEVHAARRQRLAATLPELPWDRQARLVATVGLDTHLARTLTRDRALADYFEAAVAAGAEAKAAARFIVHVVLAKWNGATAADSEPPPAEAGGWASALSPARLAALVNATRDATLSSTAAKHVLDVVWGTDEDPIEAAAAMGLSQVQDLDQLRDWARAAVAEHPDQAEAYRAGKTALLGFFVGRAMAASGGRADPRRLSGVLRAELVDQACEGGAGR